MMLFSFFHLESMKATISLRCGGFKKEKNQDEIPYTMPCTRSQGS